MIEHNVFLQKDAHGFTDHLARAKKFVRVESEGYTIKRLFVK